MFGCAVVTLVGFVADPLPAQETIKAPTTVISSSQPSTSTPRSGILGRLRGRQNMTTSVSQPITTTTASTQTPSTTIQPATTSGTVTTAPVQVAEPRRGILGRRRGAATTTTIEPMITTPRSSIPSTTTPSGVVQAQGTTTTPMATANTVPVSETRQGMFSRLRGRIGR